MSDFMEGPRIPIRCSCKHLATWLVYNKSVKQEQHHCEEHVPTIGTPRIKRLKHRPDGFWQSAPAPPGVIY